MRFILLSIFMTSLSFASSFKVEKESESFYLKDNNKKICELQTIGGTPKFIKSQRIKKTPEIVLLQYYAGTAGTHVLVDSYRACVYNTKTKQFLGDIPYRYNIEKGKIKQPKINITEKELIAIDEENDETFKIKLK